MLAIYGILNLKNNFRYIGSAIDVQKRFRQHKSNLFLNKHPNRYLQNAWNKYGEENFQFEIIEECKRGKLIDREQYYIDLYESYNREKGYNIRKEAKSNIGLKFSEETKRKMSDKRKGKNHPNYGKHISKETKKKMSISHRGEKSYLAKLTWILVEEIREKYNTNLYSTRKLAKEYNVGKSTIACIVVNKTWVKEDNNNGH